MNLIADILLVAGSFGAAIYCYVLSGRLKKFTTLETGMGGAIAVLSAQVDDMTRALEKARTAATGSADGLQALTARVAPAGADDLPWARIDGAAAVFVSGGDNAAMRQARRGDLLVAPGDTPDPEQR